VPRRVRQVLARSRRQHAPGSDKCYGALAQPQALSNRPLRQRQLALKPQAFQQSGAEFFPISEAVVQDADGRAKDRFACGGRNDPTFRVAGRPPNSSKSQLARLPTPPGVYRIALSAAGGTLALIGIAAMQHE
jgi:hypothetical protein